MIFERLAISMHTAKYYFIGISNMWYLITIPNLNIITLFFFEISQQTLKMYFLNGHNYIHFAQNQILFYVHQRPIVPDHSTQYEETPYSLHGGMCKDGQADSQTDRANSYISPRHILYEHSLIVQQVDICFAISRSSNSYFAWNTTHIIKFTNFGNT